MKTTSGSAVTSAPAMSRVIGRSDQLSEQSCRRNIARYRGKLEWLMRIPELEEDYAAGLKELDFSQPRRGINLRSVLDTLPLENKFRLIIWAFRQYRKPFQTKYADHVCQMLALDLWNSRRASEHLTARQWDKFNEHFQLTLAKEHRVYKRSQTVLFRRYQSLLHKLVNRQVFDPNKRPDAFQEASLGLVHAIDKVEDSSASFGSYARTWITRHIRNFLMENHFPVHVPINLASRILRQGDAEGAESATDRQQALQELAKPGLSLDQLSDDEDQARQFPDHDAILPCESSSQRDIHKLLHSCMAELTEKQRQVLTLRYGLNGAKDGQTLSVIANAVGISHQQVSMREKRALQKLESVLRPMMAECE